MGNNDILSKVKNIATGHYKELFNKNQQLAEKRLAICRDCPLFLMTTVGPRCDKTKTIKHVTKGTLVNGCWCRLNAKTRNEEAECPAGKW